MDIQVPPSLTLGSPENRTFRRGDSELGNNHFVDLHKMLWKKVEHILQNGAMVEMRNNKITQLNKSPKFCSFQHFGCQFLSQKKRNKNWHSPAMKFLWDDSFAGWPSRHFTGQIFEKYGRVIWVQVQYHIINLSILCDLFRMIKWPEIRGYWWPPTRE